MKLDLNKIRHFGFRQGGKLKHSHSSGEIL